MLQAVVIDDEPLAISIIRQYLEKITYVNLLASFHDPIEGLEYLNNHSVDILFLDIEMADLSGLDIARSLDKKVRIIFTTAYAEHAVKSYELAAVDYLLKPFEFPRFLQAVQRAKALSGPEGSHDFIFLKTGFDHVRVDLDRIQCIHASGNYMEFWIDGGKKIVSRITLQETQNILPGNSFARIHKSWIIAIAKIDKVERHQIWISNRTIPIGTQFREAFFKKFSHLFE